MRNYTISVTEDQALVLSEFFARFDDTDKLRFEHAAEYLALQRLSSQVDETTAAMFSPEYASLLAAARERITRGSRATFLAWLRVRSRMSVDTADWPANKPMQPTGMERRRLMCEDVGWTR